MNKQISFFLKQLKGRKNHAFFIVAGTAVASATIALLFTLLVSQKNPNKVLKNVDRFLVMEESLRFQENNQWTSGLNFRLIKEHIETIDGIESATVYHGSRVQHWVGDARIESSQLYADHRFTDFFKLDFIYGGYFSEEEYNSEANVIVISERSAKLLFGKLDVVGETVTNQHGAQKVIGVYKNFPALRYLDLSGSFDEIVPLTHDDIRDRNTSIDEGDYTYVSLLKVANGVSIDRVKASIRASSKEFEVRPEGMELVLTPFSPSEFLYGKLTRSNNPNRTVNRTEYQFFVSSVVLIVILSVICLVNITNLTFTTLINRHVELGVRMAFGANRNDVFKLGFIEATVYGLLSSTVGILLLFFFFEVLNATSYSKNLNYSINSFVLGILAIYCFLIPLFSYCIALVKLNKKQPVSLLKGVL